MSTALAGLSSLFHSSASMTVSRPLTNPHECRRNSEIDSFSNVDRAQRHIDLEIAKLNDSVRALKTRRNALVSVSRLPPEILSHVFTFCTYAGHGSGSNLSWIKVSHVCRHWRTVALACPTLWCCIVFSRPKWAAEMLKRSKMAPLVIEADLAYMTPKMVDAVQSTLEHISRIQELHINASAPALKSLLSTLCLDANRLQTLCISNSHGVGYALSENIFNSATPRLRRLDLVNCKLPWSSPLLTGLTHLKVRETDMSVRPTLVEVTSALEKMPNLQTLDLENCLHSPRDTAVTAPNAERVISLPRLSFIRISSSVLECASLLNHLSFPVTTSVHAVCTATRATDDDFSSIYPVISSMWSSSTSKQCSRKLFRSLFTQLSPTGIRLQAWSSASGTDESRHRTPPIDLQLVWSNHDHRKTEQVLRAMCKALPLALLTSLHVVGDIGKASWLESFGKLPKLRSVRVQRSSVHGLIKALVAEVGEEQQTDIGALGRKASLRRKNIVAPTSVYFPGLRRLTLDETDFEFPKPLLEPLRTCLMERYERGAEVRELVIVECSHLGEEDVDLLDEIVVDVDWDGLGQRYSDSEDEMEYDSMGSEQWYYPW